MRQVNSGRLKLTHRHNFDGVAFFFNGPLLVPCHNSQVIAKIAKAHEKTTAQVVLRWHVQSGYIAVPGSKNPDHIAENMSIFDFELTDDEMKQIATLDTGHRYENW